MHHLHRPATAGRSEKRFGFLGDFPKNVRGIHYVNKISADEVDDPGWEESLLVWQEYRRRLPLLGTGLH